MIEVREAASGRDLGLFIEFPYGLYRGDPCWVPPLRGDVRRRLTDHPFLRYAECRPFLARRAGRVVGRVAAILNRRYNEFHGTNTGFFGWFECEDDQEAASALLQAAARALKPRAVGSILGPASPSPNGEFGLLIEGFDRPPALMMPYHKPYYRRLLEGCGLRKAKDLLAYEVSQDRLDPKALKLFERIAARHSDFKVREMDLSRFDEELATVLRLYNAAWERNWGFCPMSDDEFRYEARELRRILDPRVVLFAEVGGQAAAFSLSVPDYNIALRHAGGRLFPFGWLKVLYHARRIDRLRTILLGVAREFRGRGLDAVLVGETIRRGTGVGYRVSDCSWVLEDNASMRHAIERFGGTVTQTYRVFELGL